MASETMTAEERFWAAARLEKPDRVPIVPILGPVPCAHFLGWSQASVTADPERGLEALLRVCEEYGPIDGVDARTVFGHYTYTLTGMKVRVPGKDLPDDVPFQTQEMEVMKVEDYDTVAENGFGRFLLGELVPRVSAEFQTRDDMEAMRVRGAQAVVKGYNALREMGSYPFLGGGGIHPFFQLSLVRSMVKFTEDLYYRPEKVERALKKMAPEIARRWTRECKASGVNVAFFVEERAGAFFYPLRVFERFWWPYTEQIVDMLWSEGIVSWFHIDTNWSKNLPYFKRLPKGSGIIDLDGTTDVFAAKEVLRGHMCISSDVHPALLSIGTPEEVEAYCKKLIDGLGDDGGHILSSGCEVPYSCKPENFRAMMETGRKYQLSK